MEDNKTLEHTRTTLVTFLFLLIFLICASLWIAEPFFLAIAMGSIFTLLTQPLFLKLRAQGFPPSVASATVTIGVLLLIVIPVSIFLSLAVKQGMTIANLAVNSETHSLQTLIATLSKSSIFEVTGFSPEELYIKILEVIQNAG